MGREWGVRERESDCGVHVCCVFEAGEEIRDLEKKRSLFGRGNSGGRSCVYLIR